MPSGDADNLRILRSRIRAPLLWILLPLIGGYMVARIAPIIPAGLFLGIGGFLATTWLFIWWKRWHRQIWWKIIGVGSVFILSWGYLLLHLPPNINWGDKPEREVNLTIRVNQIRSLEDKYDRQAGYAEVVEAPKHLKTLIGQKISYFLFQKDKTAEELVRSEVVRVRGVLASILENSNNSYENYLFSQGITFKLSRGEILERVSKPKKFYNFCKKQNERLEAVLAKGVNKRNLEAENIYSAMLLGNQASLTADQKYAFQITGSLHLFSISGLHVAMVGAFIAFFLRLVKVPDILGAIIGLIALFLYVEVTGGAPSAMRAFLMVAFYWGARGFRRKKSAFSALLAAGLVGLITNPFDLWNIGFQLSYGVVASILLYGVPLNEVINNWINEKFAKWNGAVRYGFRWILNLIGISVAANIGSTFLSILYFKTFAPGAVLLSLVVIPLASVVIVIGCISLLFGLVGLNVISGLINPISWFIIKMMEGSIGLSLKIPGIFWESFTAISLLTKVTLVIVFIMLYLGHVLNKLQRLEFYSLPIAVIIAFAVLSYL